MDMCSLQVSLDLPLGLQQLWILLANIKMRKKTNYDKIVIIILNNFIEMQVKVMYYFTFNQDSFIYGSMISSVLSV
jgi:hypothetical protein